MAKQPKRPTRAQKISTPIPEGMTRIFVYGTLRRGGRLNYMIAKENFVCPASTEPLYRMFDNGAYPYLMLAEDVPGPLAAKSIVGELWDVSPETLEKLQYVEHEYSELAIRVAGHDEPIYAFVIDKMARNYKHVLEGIEGMDRLPYVEMTDFIKEHKGI